MGIKKNGSCKIPLLSIDDPSKAINPKLPIPAKNVTIIVYQDNFVFSIHFTSFLPLIYQVLKKLQSVKNYCHVIENVVFYSSREV